MIQAAVKLCAVAGYCLVTNGLAFADQTDTSADISSFLPENFSRYSPLTALDMVAQVPGFSIDNGDDVRGFGGAAGNVLINGERPSTKSSLEDYLRRIPAGNVERIDLVRGASGDLDMRGQTRVVNVVLKESVGNGPINYSINPRIHQGGRVSVGAVIDWTGKWLGGDLTLSYSQDGWAERSIRPERRFDGDGDQIAYRDDVHQTNFIEYVPGFEYERKFGSDTTLRANGRFWTGFWEANIAAEKYEPTRRGHLALSERGTIDEDWTGYDFGGDIERKFSRNLSSKIIWYQRRQQFESELVFDDFTPDGHSLGLFLGDVEDKTGESILRSQTNWTASKKHSVEFGMEVAYNFRDSDRVYLFLDTNNSATGDVPISTTKVEEWRGEAFISDVWKLANKWTLEPGLKVEVSEISQTGQVEEKRQFTYPKPSLSAVYSPSEGRQWRFQIERWVDQLDFSDFVSNVSATDDNVTSGNPQLEPERSWRFEVGYERPLMKSGTVSFLAQFEAVEKVADFVPVVTADGKVFDGPGNLGNGQRFKFVAESSFPTDAFGVKGGKLDLELVYRDSEVTDPLTGMKRRLAYEQPLYWYIEFRQDFPIQKWTWGFDYAQGSTDSYWRSNEQVDFKNGFGDFDIYMETTRFLGMNIRVGVDNVFNTTFTRRRTIYDGDRATGEIDRRDIRVDNYGALPFIRFKGTI